MGGEFAAPAVETEHSRLRAFWRARMSPWRLVVAVSALALATAGAVMVGLWIATSGEHSSSYSFSGPLLGLDIDVERGNIQILGGGRSDVHVRRTDHFAYGREPAEQLDLSKGVLSIKSQCAELVVGTCSADYSVAIPDNVSVTVRVSGGNVRLADYRGSAEVTARGGSIDVDGFCGFALRATARQGDIRVATACAPERLELRSDSGDVTAIVPPGRYQIDADSNSGRVAVDGVTTADDAPWFIQALSGSGDVTVGAQS